MSEQIFCPQKDMGKRKTAGVSLGTLIRKAICVLTSRKRRRIRLADLPPDLRKDIGHHEPLRGYSSLEQKWAAELERLKR